MKEVMHKWKIKKEDIPVSFRALYGSDKQLVESEIERVKEEILFLEFHLYNLNKKLEELA